MSNKLQSIREEFEKVFAPEKIWVVPSNDNIKTMNEIADFFLSKFTEKLGEVLEPKDCPHDSHSHCMEEECYLNEPTGYNKALSDIRQAMIE